MRSRVRASSFPPFKEKVFTPSFFMPRKRQRRERIIEFERGASRVRSAFAKRMIFFEAKHVDTFNASDSRQPRRSRHLKKTLYWVFFNSMRRVFLQQVL